MIDRTDAQKLSGFFNIMLAELEKYRGDPAVDRQIARARKKARFTKPELQLEAIDKFISNNDRVGKFELRLDDDIVENARAFIFYALCNYTISVDEEAIQTPLLWEHICDLWAFGPGSSFGVVGTHTVDKISQDMTCTARCEPWVVSLRRNNPYFQCNDARKGRTGITVVPGSKLTTVPKNEDAVRTIAIEPSGSMCLQKAAGFYLEGVLRRIGLDIRKQQPKNKALARIGSLTDQLATIDLSLASDSISLPLVRCLFPPEWYSFMCALRSPKTQLPDGRSLDLSMISTMGNGFTFPMMTLVFTSLIYAMRCRFGGPSLFIDWSQTAVYGDDIIVPSTEYPSLRLILEDAGFIVNDDKSYSTGPFRESCGGDFYLGREITPVYVKSLARDSNVFVVINQVLEFCGREKIYLFATLDYLFSLLNVARFVPEWHNPDQGVLCISGPRKYTYLSPKLMRKRLRDESYLVPLAIGGYVYTSGSDIVYSTRAWTPRYEVRRGRIPKGYATGQAFDKRPAHISQHIQLILDMM